MTRLAAVAVAAALALAITPATTLAAVDDWAQFRESQTHQAHNVAPAPGPSAHAIFDVTGYFVP